MTEPSDQDRLAALEQKIAKLKGADAPTPHGDEHYSQANLAWRMVIELVSGLGIGFGIGFGLDKLFGTMPIFLILFVLLGFAAGVRVMMRTAAEIGKTAEEKDGATAPVRKDDERGD